MDNVKKFSRKIFWDSLSEVLILTIFAILPLIINFFIQATSTGSVYSAFSTIVVPRELLTYSLSFLSPTLYLILVKNNGSGYKLPSGTLVSMLGFIIYIICLCLYLVNKNGWLNLDNPTSFYLGFSITFLIMTLIFRIYTTYHNKNITNFSVERKTQQESFNSRLARKVNGQ